MKENSALNLSSHPNFEGIFNAAMDRIDIEIKRARENAVSHDQYMAIRKEQTELVNAIGADQNRNDEISKKIDEL
ncbi:MAG TPA: hypothetical protein VEC13_03500, partial [Candidatus Paceibacterota bacterium]|nr:hypothetical protein [Candidatus Paceibacterota bacterium]